MPMQAMQYGNPAEAALHIQANDCASGSTGAATQGELLGSSHQNAFGAPAQPGARTTHRGELGQNPVPVKQSSADAAQVWATV